MQVLVSPSSDPYFNLALEEALLKDQSLREPLLLFYVNARTVVIGRNQNAYAEINAPYVAAQQINVIRRLSGGGAVYHDLGNINFSFITARQAGEAEKSYQAFLAPIVAFLATLGLSANFKGRNDLEIAGAKFSGSAQYRDQNRMFHHGTILFDSDLTVLSAAINADPLKFTSKAVQSVRARVTNLRPLLLSDLTPAQFLQAISTFFATQPSNAWAPFDALSYQPALVSALRARLQSVAWTYGQNPPFNFSAKQKLPGGIINVVAKVVDGQINSIKFYGDFLSRASVSEIEALLQGVAFSPSAVSAVFASVVSWADYFGSISAAELVSLIFSNTHG